MLSLDTNIGPEATVFKVWIAGALHIHVVVAAGRPPPVVSLRGSRAPRGDRGNPVQDAGISPPQEYPIPPIPSPLGRRHVNTHLRSNNLAASALVLTSALLFAVFATQARAEVKQSVPGTLLLEFSQHLNVKPSKVYDALPRVQKWWSSQHTYSGNAANLSLLAEAGGCFCEHWKDGSVEHGTVIVAMRNKLLRIRTALGPLQAKAATGILTFQIKPDGDGAVLNTEYRVVASAESALDQMAPIVDKVLGEQLARLGRLIETGSPESK
jgi:uncharacterized protein YndB with AHSA1/START domain